MQPPQPPCLGVTRGGAALALFQAFVMTELTDTVGSVATALQMEATGIDRVDASAQHHNVVESRRREVALDTKRPTFDGRRFLHREAHFLFERSTSAF